MKRGKLILIFMSILFTLALWIAMSQTVTPYTTRVFTGIKVQPRGLGDNKVVLGELPLVTIRVRGPSDIVSTMPPPVAWVMIPSDAIGDVVLNINVDLPSSVNLVDINPSSVAIRIDVLSYKTVDIEVLTSDKRDITPYVEVLPPQISIKGPKTYVSAIAKAVVVLEKMPTSPILLSTGDVILMDSAGKPKEKTNLTIEPSEIKIAPISQRHEYIQLPIIPNIRGYIEGEYMLADIKLDPPFAVVRTSTDRLPVSFLPTATIDLSGRPTSLDVKLRTDKIDSIGKVIYPQDGTIHITFVWKKTKVYKIKSTVNGAPWITLIRCPEDIEPPPDIVDGNGHVKTDKLPPTCIVIYSGIY